VNFAARCAAAVRCCEMSANSSWRSRVMPYRPATTSAVWPMGM